MVGVIWMAWMVQVAVAAGTSGPFNVLDYGAKANDQIPDTEAIQRAMYACAQAGGGTVVIPPGHYLCGPISLSSKISLHLDKGAVLQATSCHEDFMERPGDWLTASSGDFVPLITGKDLTDITLSGQGTIDGNGQHWWGPAQEARRERPGYTLPRPNLIVLTRCKTVRITGLTIQNSPKFHLVPTECEDVIIDGLTIRAPADSPNTDGIDPSRSCRVKISRCVIDVGDDNIAVKSSSKVPGREFACEDITVTDCQFLHGHGMSIGSETVGGVRNVTVERCTFKGTENGIRIKTARGRGGQVVGLRCSEITMTDVDQAITITCYYPRIPQEDVSQPVTELTPALRDIQISRLTATCPQEAGLIIGLPESKVCDVLLEQVSITAKTGLVIRNATGVQLRDVTVKTTSGPPFVVADAVVEGLMD